ncbi:hypothetical protein MGAST_05240 [Mycobacterium gastri 'Wayne']|nr:hypothetical protein MGAST_05240 [Mycobacterium gastri 'Wayne']
MVDGTVVDAQSAGGRRQGGAVCRSGGADRGTGGAA